MKKLLFALANVLLVHMSVHSQDPVKSGQPDFDVLRDNIAHGNIDNLATRVR
ncbi:MAG TPA: hypothetical protein VJ765_07510 [Chitinophagaceae bacterium]|nr:hypothetical protein [Chitinophagaceae bacterium]